MNLPLGLTGPTTVVEVEVLVVALVVLVVVAPVVVLVVVVVGGTLSGCGLQAESAVTSRIISVILFFFKISPLF